MSTEAQEVQYVQPYFGRSIDYSRHTVHLFASAELDGDTTIAVEGRVPVGNWQGTPQVSGKCNEQLDASLTGPRLWHLRSGGTSLVRTPEEESVAPLDPNDVQVPLPAGVQQGGSGWFKLEVALATTVGFKQFFMDVGEDIEFYGFGANIVGMRGPANTALVTPVNATTLSRSGVVVDSRIGCEIAAIEVPRGRRVVRFTQHVPVPMGTIVDVDVSRYAKRVTVYQTAAGTPSTAWTRQVGAGGAGSPLGTLDFSGRTSRLEDRPIGDETVLRTDLDNIADRFFTLVWEIEP